MRIHSMTATFGKLSHETLTLEPGLNIIEAPNEWGKSTWCAFLVNMLYGIDTKARSTGVSLAEKEKYAPWSGNPMAGRIDLNWDGRDITIERSSKGRIPFGVFRAYETATGIDIPELNSANCGQTLLGVERSVFLRAGFLRLADLPVTQDDSLRRRLNNLVTTGDESDAGDALGKTLKDLKNKCRHNRTGLLPQAEKERDHLKEQLNDLHDLAQRAVSIRTQQQQLEEQLKLLKNHKAALEYAASIHGAQQLQSTESAKNQLQDQIAQLEARCASLPSAEEAERALERLQQLQQQWITQQSQQNALPQPPQPPVLPERWQGYPAEAIVKTAEEDAAQQKALQSQKNKAAKATLWALILTGIITIGGIAAGLLLPGLQVLVLCAGGFALLAAATTIFLSCHASRKRNRELNKLCERYAGLSAEQWVSDAQQHRDILLDYDRQLQSYQKALHTFEESQQALNQATEVLTGGGTLADCRQKWLNIQAQWDLLADARQEYSKTQAQLQTLQTLVKPVSPPSQPDTLELSKEDTDARLSSLQFEQHQLHQQLGKVQGQSETIGQESLLKARLETLSRRIERLEDTYYALELAQDTLYQATLILQRRFAPRISKRAQELFCQLTGGRYPRFILGEDLTLSASAQDEDTVRSAQWRSEGTVDQLYLALRLAVAEALTPDAPLILDDALVRFDDKRLAAALNILKEASDSKQVLLFTCQSREKATLNAL